MSMIIGICGTNFCSLIADGRLVSFHHNTVPKVISEEYQKIRKINNRVLFGVAGLLAPGEDIMAPFSQVDRSTISVKMAYRSVLDYLKKNSNQIKVRNYIVGGKNHDGEFFLYEVHFDSETKRIQKEIRKPTPTNNFGVSIALPFSVTNVAGALGAVGEIVTKVKTHDELICGAGAIIQYVAESDPTVGKVIFTESVF